MTGFDSVLSGTVILGAATGLLVAFWARLRALALRATGLLIVRARLEDTVADAVISHLWRHGRRSRVGSWGLRRFGAANYYVRPLREFAAVAHEGPSTEPIVFWLGRCPLAVHMIPVNQHGQTTPTFGGVNVELTFPRGLLDLERLVTDTVDDMNARKHGPARMDEQGRGVGRFRVQTFCGRGRRTSDVFGRGDQGGDNAAPQVSPVLQQFLNHMNRLLRWKEEDLGPERSATPYAHLAFPPHVTQAVEEVRRWAKSKDWYAERQIPWRRGLLLWGAPGTGKTSLARAIAMDLDMPVFRFDLASMSNRDMTDFWGQALAQAPCMVLLEDLDGVFKGRDNRLGEKGGGLTFDCLLNCVSGVEAADGLLLVVTTNHIEDLDPAIGVPAAGDKTTRPGRIDRAVELPTLDADGRRAVAARILAGYEDEVDELVRLGATDSGAQFTERCARRALELYWAPSSVPLPPREAPCPPPTSTRTTAG